MIWDYNINESIGVFANWGFNNNQLRVIIFGYRLSNAISSNNARVSSQFSQRSVCFNNSKMFIKITGRTETFVELQRRRYLLQWADNIVSFVVG